MLSYPLQGSSKKLYFARDPLGRRSLLIHKPTLTCPIFLLASVSAGNDNAYEFEELSTNGIFVLDLDTLREPENVCISDLCPQKPDGAMSLQFVTDFPRNLVVIPRASGEHMPFVCKHPSERFLFIPLSIIGRNQESQSNIAT